MGELQLQVVLPRGFVQQAGGAYLNWFAIVGVAQFVLFPVSAVFPRLKLLLRRSRNVLAPPSAALVSWTLSGCRVPFPGAGVCCVHVLCHRSRPSLLQLLLLSTAFTPHATVKPFARPFTVSLAVHGCYPRPRAAWASA